MNSSDSWLYSRVSLQDLPSFHPIRFSFHVAFSSSCSNYFPLDLLICEMQLTLLLREQKCFILPELLMVIMTIEIIIMNSFEFVRYFKRLLHSTKIYNYRCRNILFSDDLCRGWDSFKPTYFLYYLLGGYLRPGLGGVFKYLCKRESVERKQV